MSKDVVNRELIHWGGQSVAVRGLPPEAIVSALGGIVSEKFPAEEALRSFYDRALEVNWSFGKDNGPLPLLVSAPLEGWTFCYYNYLELEAIVARLLQAGATEAHGFYGDSQVDGYGWVIGRSARIVRVVDYCQGFKKEEGQAICQEEAEWVRLKRSSDDEEEDRAAFGEDMVTTVFRAACGIEAAEHAVGAPCLLAEVPRYEDKPAPPPGLVYDTIYRSGPLAVADWVAGGNFDGYVYRYELRLFADGRYVLHIPILDATRSDDPAQDREEKGNWVHTDKGTFTLDRGRVQWRGLVTGDRGQYLVCSVFSSYGSSTICLERAER